MASVIKLKRRTADATAPTTSDLVDGEVAVNTVSRNLFIRSGSDILKIGGDVFTFNKTGTSAAVTPSGANLTGAKVSMVRETGAGDEEEGTLELHGSSTITVTRNANDTVTFTSAGGTMTGIKINEDAGTAETISATSGTDIELNFGIGLNKSVSGTVATITSELASDSNAGIASFNATDFSVAGSGENAVTLNAERIQDITGAMISGNSESGISVTYEDGDGTLDFAVQVDDSSIEIASGTLNVKALGVTNAMLAGSIAATKLAGSIPDSKLNTITTAGKVDLNSLEIDGESNAVTALADADLFIVDDGGGGTNSKMAATVIPTYAFSKISGDITINSSGVATIGADTVALGTDTTGNFVATLADAGNDFTISNSGDEDAAVTIGLGNSDGDISVTRDATVGRNLVTTGNLTVNGDTISIGAGTSTTTVGDNLVVAGDLTVNGTTTTVNSTTVTIDDNLLKVADNNTGDATDFGFYGQYVESATTKYAGLIRDNSIAGDPFVFFSGISGTEGTILGNNVTYTPGTHEAPVIMGSLTAKGNSSVTGTLDVSALASLDGGIDVDGAFTVADTSGNIATSGTLSVTGLTTLNGGITADGGAFTVADTTGNIATTGQLSVTGATALNGGLTMDTDKFVVADTTGNMTSKGTGTIEGNFTVGTGGSAFAITAATGAIDNAIIDGGSY